MWLYRISNDIRNVSFLKLQNYLGLVKLALTYQTGEKLRKLCIFVQRTYVELNLCHLIRSAPMHTRVHYMPAVSMGDYWNTKISAITRFQRIFSQFARKLHFLEKKTTYLQKYYTKRFYICSFYTVSVIYANVFNIRS